MPSASVYEVAAEQDFFAQTNEQVRQNPEAGEFQQLGSGQVQPVYAIAADQKNQQDDRGRHHQTPNCASPEHPAEEIAYSRQAVNCEAAVLETRHKSRCSQRDQKQDRIVNNNPDGMKARILRQPLHHKMHGVTEHEYQKAEQEQAPSGTQLSAVMKDLAQANGAPASQYARRGIASTVVLYMQSGGCVFRSGRRCLLPAYLPSHAPYSEGLERT